MMSCSGRSSKSQRKEQQYWFTRASRATCLSCWRWLRRRRGRQRHKSSWWSTLRSCMQTVLYLIGSAALAMGASHSRKGKMICSALWSWLSIEGTWRCLVTSASRLSSASGMQRNWAPTLSRNSLKLLRLLNFPSTTIDSETVPQHSYSLWARWPNLASVM